MARNRTVTTAYIPSYTEMDLQQNVSDSKGKQGSKNVSIHQSTCLLCPPKNLYLCRALFALIKIQGVQSAPTSQPQNGQGGGRSAIPSYQEIYREMGLESSQDPRRRRQQQQQLNAQQHAGPRRPQHAPPQPVAQQQQQRPHPTGFAARRSSLPGPVGAAHVARGYPGQAFAGQCRSSLHFGHLHRDVLEEGKELYKREDLLDVGGHLGPTREWHGSVKEGCDSLCISNLVRDRAGFVLLFRQNDPFNSWFSTREICN